MTAARSYPAGMSAPVAHRLELTIEAAIDGQRCHLAETLDLHHRSHGDSLLDALTYQAKALRQLELGYEALTRNSPSRYDQYRPAIYREA